MSAKQRYAYLGPDGTYSHAAMLQFAESRGLRVGEYEPLRCGSIEEVFEAVDRGRADFGVTPVENALEGDVTATLDMLAFSTTAEILAELVLDIHHCLIAAPGTQLADITHIASHAQALGQCRRFITEDLPRAETVSASSTADSVRLAMENPGWAGIGTPLAAELSGADILARSIEDHYGNQTRFLLIGPQGTHHPQTGNDKTTLALFMRQDHSGVLLMILSEFAYAGINLSYIQSRPLKRALGEYMFFVDLEGHVDDPEVATALNCLRLKLREVKVLGSYPRFEVAPN